MRLDYSFNFNKKNLADQFTLVSARLVTHAACADELNAYIRKSPPHHKREYGQVYLNENGGPALAALDSSMLRMPLITTAEFGDEVIAITKARSGTQFCDTVCRKEPQAQSAAAMFPPGSLPNLIPPPNWDWVGALKTRMARKGAQVRLPNGGLSEAAVREKRRLINMGAPAPMVEKIWGIVANIRQDFGWEGPVEEQYPGQPGTRNN